MTPQPARDFRERVEQIAASLSPYPDKLNIFRDVTDRVDPNKVAALQEKYAGDIAKYAGDSGGVKYADLPFWILDKIHTAMELNLHRGPPRNILDIGMGGGHFALVCQTLGHRVVGTDKSMPLYNDVCEIFGVDRRIVPTKLRVPMPDLNEKFDLVVAIGQLFNVIWPAINGNVRYWAPEDWEYFLRDLVVNHMRYPGSIFLHLNPNIVDRKPERDLRLLQWARDHGATADEFTNKVLFTGIDGWQTLDAAARASHAGSSTDKVKELPRQIPVNHP